MLIRSTDVRKKVRIDDDRIGGVCVSTEGI